MSWRVTCQAQDEEGSPGRKPPILKPGGVGKANIAALQTPAGSPNFTKQGANASASIGVGRGFDIDLSAKTNYSCSAEVTVNDTKTGRSTTGEATFEVRVGQEICWRVDPAADACDCTYQ